MTMLELGWLSGIIEGEGSIMVTYPKDRNFRVAVSVEMTDEDVVRRLQEVSGVGRVIANRSRNPKWKPTWSWRVQAKSEVLELVKVIKPLMGARHTQMIDNVLDTCG